MDMYQVLTEKVLGKKPKKFNGILGIFNFKRSFWSPCLAITRIRGWSTNSSILERQMRRTLTSHPARMRLFLRLLSSVPDTMVFAMRLERRRRYIWNCRTTSRNVKAIVYSKRMIKDLPRIPVLLASCRKGGIEMTFVVYWFPQSDT